MKRSNLKKAAADTLVVNMGVNFRDDYDVPSMMEEILQQRRILEPVHIREDDKVVLKGNRRIAAAQELLKDQTLPADIRKALESVDVFYYTDLSERETTELVLDHGSQKPLSRVETVKAIWRLQRQSYTERDIITLLYHQLAKYTGKARKAHEASQLPAGEAREKYLTTWLHGTVGNYLMAAGCMGDFVKRQLVLTETQLDRSLTEAEKLEVKFEVSRDRVNKLATAKKKDKETLVWTPDAGGKMFNEMIDKFIEEDKLPKAPRSNKVTSEQMEQTADSLQSGLRLAFLQCAGKLPEGEKHKIDSLDTEYQRRDQVMSALTVDADRIDDPKIKHLVRAILHGAAGDVSKALAPFISQAVAANVG